VDGFASDTNIVVIEVSPYRFSGAGSAVSGGKTLEIYSPVKSIAATRGGNYIPDGKKIGISPIFGMSVYMAPPGAQ
jgi:hypothetical protein